MSEIATRMQGIAPAGTRALGSRVKPIIRLGMGVKKEGTRKDGSTYTRPDKTDYFTVRGDERAAAKFTHVYGEKPKAVKIMVPSSLPLALDISYRSFVGGGSEDGGRPLALGMTNFAPLGYVGGPDVLRVWKQDGSYIEVETEGLDEQGNPADQIAADLNIEVYTTFTFTIPDVLGWGSFAAVTSKGKKSADNLTFKLTEIYSAFGAKAPWAFDREDPPLLVLKPDTAMVRFEDKGEAKWGKSKIYVLDVVIPEPFETMRDRLLERQAQIAAQGGPTQMLYGPPARAALEAGSYVDYEEIEELAAPNPRESETAEPNGSLPGPAVSAPSPDEPGLDEPTVTDADFQALAEAASSYVPPNGKFGEKGEHGPKTLMEIAELPDGQGVRWFSWALGSVSSPPEYVQAVWGFARVFLPEQYQAALAKRELA